MSARLFLEGGGDSKEMHARCREGFRKLLERSGFTNRMPRLVACGSRGAAFDDFRTAHSGRSTEFFAMWIDSEEPLGDMNAAWFHVERRDGWERPDRAKDDQVLFMTTSMETYLVADSETLANHFGKDFQSSALPPLVDLERRTRSDILDALEHATRSCKYTYRNGERSYEILGKVSPEVLAEHLPSFQRARAILKRVLRADKKRGSR